VPEPLLFVCRRESGPERAVTFRSVTIKSPTGPVFMAFESLTLASTIVQFFGIAANAFLVPETDLSPEIVGSVGKHRVVIFRTAADYQGATGHASGFPWPDRTVLYDFEAALARRSR
jgi:hypothetical protein